MASVKPQRQASPTMWWQW